MNLNENYITTPEWINDLIVYEIATKSFTSPNGPESGTFKSLKEKMAYLYDLGVTGIWLTGHSLSNPDHFYNIWTQYACIEPDHLDPTLGTPEDFKAMVDEAHRLGIKVFLDVITHGVMSDSPLIKQHPDWFKGGSWGMTDYDWDGDHPDLDEWWVSTWVNYVKKFGIDGFRLDVAAYRPDLWYLVRKKANQIGHPIVIFPEVGPAFMGFSDFLQHGIRLSENLYYNTKYRILRDLSAYIKEVLNPDTIQYSVKIEYEDGTARGDTLEVKYKGCHQEELIHPTSGGRYIANWCVLQVNNGAVDKKISNIIVEDKQKNQEMYQWSLKGEIAVDNKVDYKVEGSTLEIRFPIRLPKGQKLSIQLSCHDNGWTGYDKNKSPYVSHGSRYIFGYALLFAPGVPIFMAGEEFNADYTPLPKLTPELFGEGTPGEGRWLYGSWIKWDQLKDQEKADMFKDVQKMIEIRKKEQDFIHPAVVGSDVNLISVPYEADVELPKPYAYYNEDSILLIAANHYKNKDITIKFQIPLDILNNWDQAKVTDLWKDKEIGNYFLSQLKKLEWTINKDKSPRGGLLVLKIVRI